MGYLDYLHAVNLELSEIDMEDASLWCPDEIAKSHKSHQVGRSPKWFASWFVAQRDFNPQRKI